MKFENFDKAKSLIESIKCHQQTVDELQIHGLTLFLNNSFHKIYTIGLDPSSEHQYAKFGRELVNSISADLHLRIAKMMEELETL